MARSAAAGGPTRRIRNERVEDHPHVSNGSRPPGVRGRTARIFEIGQTARHRQAGRVLRELGILGTQTAPTREGAREFRRTLEELGTTFIKLGQLLSSRPELLPDVYIEELGRLTDEATPIAFAEIEPVIAADIGLEHFAEIDPEPLASASIAQVHRARLVGGREVVVKVRRPGIEEEVALDLDLLRRTASRLERRSETARVVQIDALAEELAVHLRGELDLSEEAGNAELIAGLAAEEPTIVVPAVVRPLVSERVLVLERIEGVKIGHDNGLPPERARELAESLFHFYVRQVTLAGFYHADPHKGNVLLTPDGRLALLDFGLLGRLDDDTRRGLAVLLLSVAQNRADDVADQVLGLSLTLLDADAPGFIHELRRKLPRYHWRSLSSIRAGEALADLQRMAVTHGIRLPTSLALVGKTLAQADTIARTLDPELDPIALIRDDSTRIVLSELEQRLHPAALLAFAAPQAEELLKLPRRVARVVERLDTGTLKIGIVPSDLGDLEHVVKTSANRMGAALIVVGLLIASALMAKVNHTVALVGFCLAAVIGLAILWKVARTPGEL
jgi:ubiquinone biosynthesis protein